MRIVHNGFSYHTSVVRKDNTLRYLICAQYNKCRCLGRAILPAGSSIEQLKVTQPHNHPPDDSLHGKSDFYSKLKLMAEEAPANVSLKTIYDSAIQLYPEFSISVPYLTVRTSMRRWRNKVQANQC